MNIPTMMPLKATLNKPDYKKATQSLKATEENKTQTLPYFAYKSNFLSFKGNDDNIQLRKEVDQLKQELNFLRSEFNEFKNKFEPSNNNEKTETPRKSKFISTNAQIAYDEIVTPMIENSLTKDEDRNTLEKYKENEKFLKIVQSYPNINKFLKEIREKEKMSLNLLKANLSSFMIWEFILAKPRVLLELNTIGTKYENADIYKDMKKEMERDYYGRSSRFGDVSLSEVWLKKLGNDPSKMSDEDKITRLINTSGGEKKMLKEETIKIARETPLAVKKMAELMDTCFDNYIETYKIKD
ncbi:MAG: hypothetical protein WCK67_07375 [bacterium]